MARLDERLDVAGDDHDYFEGTAPAVYKSTWMRQEGHGSWSGTTAGTTSALEQFVKARREAPELQGR